MTRENGYYWVQREKGTWVVGEWFRTSWSFTEPEQHLAIFDHELYTIHAERIKEPAPQVTSFTDIQDLEYREAQDKQP